MKATDKNGVEITDGCIVILPVSKSVEDYTPSQRYKAHRVEIVQDDNMLVWSIGLGSYEDELYIRWEFDKAVVVSEEWLNGIELEVGFYIENDKPIKFTDEQLSEIYYNNMTPEQKKMRERFMMAAMFGVPRMKR